MFNIKVSFVAGLLFFLACNAPKKALLQTWKVADVVFLDSVTTLTNAQKLTLAESLKSSIRFSFLPDSAYQVRSGNDVFNGQWWLSGNKKILYTTTRQGLVESKIYELNKNRFQFESNGGFEHKFVFTCEPAATDKK